MPTFPSIVSQFEWVKAEEYSPQRVFVVEDNLVKSLLVTELNQIDETHYLVGRTSEFDKFFRLPDLPIISKKVKVEWTNDSIS